MIKIYNKYIHREYYGKRITEGSVDIALEKLRREIKREEESLSILEGLSMSIERLNLEGTKMMTASVVKKIQEQMTDDVVLTYENIVCYKEKHRVITYDLKDSDIFNDYGYGNKLLLPKNEGTIEGFKSEIKINIQATINIIEQLKNKFIELESLDIDNLNNRILAVEMKLRELESEIEEIEDITRLL